MWLIPYGGDGCKSCGRSYYPIIAGIKRRLDDLFTAVWEGGLGKMSKTVPRILGVNA